MSKTTIAAVMPLAACLLATAPASRALAGYTGEPVNGFPNWSERVLHEWTNRSRVAPKTDLASCPAGNCADAACYGVMPPLRFDMPLSHSSRFHSDEMFKQKYFDHPSHCTLPRNISTIYPASCDGSASCACAGGTFYDTFDRISLFGRSGTGEIIAAWQDVDPVSIFYLWMYEKAASSSCSFSESNGHRWLLLSNSGAVGFGSSGSLYYTGDFSDDTSTGKIPSGAHDPQAGPTIDFWANWYDTAGPKSAAVVIDGAVKPLALERGTQTNGAWHAQVGNLGSTCHRYYYSFTDAAGTVVTFPATGSYGAGPPASCPDWVSARTAGAPPEGDANGDLVVNLNDVYYLVNALYAGGPAPIGKVDVNGDGKVDLSDVFYLVNYLFSGGPAPH